MYNRSRTTANWVKLSACAASIDKNAPAYSIIPEDLRYSPQRVVSELSVETVTAGYIFYLFQDYHYSVLNI